jgi:DNA-binding beta-propeller fold protein YncE
MRSHARCLAMGLALALLSSTCPAAKIVVVAGGGTSGPGSPATEAVLRAPFGTAFDAAGTMYIVEMAGGNRLLRVGPKGILEHIAGTGETGFAGDGGPALSAQFNGPHNLAVLPDGDVLIADAWNGRIRKVDVKAGTIDSIPGFSVPPDKAKGGGPYCITLDFTGKTLYVADLRRIQAIDLATGKAKVVAGNGQKGKPEDGAKAADAPLVDPRAVAPDRKGNVYILERGGHALRVVEANGKIRTVVNVKGTKGLSKDGASATDAPLNSPKHLCIDRDDSVLIADSENHVIVRYLPREEKIRWVAGIGAKGSEGAGGDPLRCGLSQPHGVSVHPKTGEIYVSDSSNNRVLKIMR